MKEFFDTAFDLFGKRWALLTAGNEENYNTMTIGWGSLGTIWGKDMVTVYVRPNRYTYKFTEENDYFTVSIFDDEYKADLTYLGRHSGRDEDKVAKTKLTAQPIENSVTFKEAEHTLLCKKIYAQDMDISQFPEDVKARYYDGEPVHRMYIGEVIKVL